MKITPFLFIFIFFVFLRTNAQNPSANANRTTDAISNFQPSLAVVISMLAIMFSLTLFLLLYAKFCHHLTSASTTTTTATATNTLPLSAPGLDKSLISSLPFFRFSSLLGSRAGLECAVCLAKFDDANVLRLLPKCNHAFHIACIDQWLEKNSTCPLCRRHVTADDLSASLRFLQNPAPAPDSNLELYVEREESFREEEEEAPMPESMLHRFNHKIVVLKSRWSNVSSSDIMLLNSAEEEKERKLGFESGLRNPDEKRSMSEIVVHPRFNDVRNEEVNVREERKRRVWLPIATKTVEWFASRERRSSPQSQQFR